jgi:hypothetical protein
VLATTRVYQRLITELDQVPAGGLEKLPLIHFGQVGRGGIPIPTTRCGTSYIVGLAPDGSLDMELVVEKTSTADLMDEAERLGRVISSTLGNLLTTVGELDRRQAWRAEGATSSGAWLTERLGIAESTGRMWSQVAERLWDLPHLAQGLRVGAITFDKVRAAVEFATPESDASVLRQAEECTVRQMTDLVRDSRGTNDERAEAQFDYRYLRFNDTRRLVSAQLTEDAYAEVRAAVTERARIFTSDGETRYDQRQADALVDLCRRPGARIPFPAGATSDAASGTPAASREAGTSTTRTGRSSSSNSGSSFLVVAHTDLSLLQGGSGRAEIERMGLLSGETIRRISCDSTVALAIDDAFGHTMFEGRSKRFATQAQRREVQRRDRRCRFPGCANNTFTDVHHVVHWADQGPTDLPNLVTMCDHHHHRVHEGKWRVTGNANGILKFVGPSGRMMTSRPSPLWTRRKA